MSANPLDDMQVDTNNLYREEMYTDLKLGTLRRYLPVRADGAEDPLRPVSYTAHTQLMTPMGMLPIDAPIEAANLAGAWEKFPAAIRQAVEELSREIQRRQMEESSRLVVPGSAAGLDLKNPGNLKLR